MRAFEDGAMLVSPIQEGMQQHARNEFSMRHEVVYDALVLDARLRQSLVTVRALGRRGKRVAALEIVDKGERLHYLPTFSSRWCGRAYIAPTYEHDEEPFRTYLHQLLEHTQVRVLIPSSDGTLAVLRERRREFERRSCIALANEASLEAVINKDTTLAIAQQLGMAVPHGVVVTSVGEVSEALQEIGLPAVVKPVESWLWGNNQRQGAQGVRLICALVTTPQEAYRAVEELTVYGGKVLFQQFLSGRREAVSLLYADGEMYARFAQWAKRTQPPLGGTSVFRQSITLPSDISAQAERLVREIDLEGYSEIEFRRDSAGKPYLMEVNPRLSASLEVAVRAGIDFPYLLYQWASGEKIDRVKGYRVGQWMRYLEGDLLTTMQTFTQRGRPGVMPPLQAVTEFLAAFLHPCGYDYFDWSDPLPAWIATLDITHRIVQKMGNSFNKKK
ncbi:MAG: ATP-grasp domain-containing protein [Chloroflexi bacterium]|nr:MAG: ATP-grasp domain-containing protein [Chloroflexota bacterium]